MPQPTSRWGSWRLTRPSVMTMNGDGPVGVITFMEVPWWVTVVLFVVVVGLVVCLVMSIRFIRLKRRG